MGAVPAQLADAFGLVIECRDRVGEQALLAQTVHTLQHAVQSGKPHDPPCWEFSTEDYQEVNKHVLLLLYYKLCYIANILLYFSAGGPCTRFASGAQPCSRENNPWLLHGEPQSAITGSGCQHVCGLYQAAVSALMAFYIQSLLSAN